MFIHAPMVAVKTALSSIGENAARELQPPIERLGVGRVVAGSTRHPPGRGWSGEVLRSQASDAEDVATNGPGDIEALTLHESLERMAILRLRQGHIVEPATSEG
jgi:hypothetical protein